MGCGDTKGVKNIFVKKYERHFSEGYKGKQERYQFIHNKCDINVVLPALNIIPSSIVE